MLGWLVLLLSTNITFAFWPLTSKLTTIIFLFILERAFLTESSQPCYSFSDLPVCITQDFLLIILSHNSILLFIIALSRTKSKNNSTIVSSYQRLFVYIFSSIITRLLLPNIWNSASSSCKVLLFHHRQYFPRLTIRGNFEIYEKVSQGPGRTGQNVWSIVDRFAPKPHW